MIITEQNHATCGRRRSYTRAEGVNCFKYWWLQKSRSYTLREIESGELRGLEGHKKSVMTVLRIDGQLMRSSHSAPLSKRPNMTLPSIYRLQTRSRAQFCVNKSARLPPAPNRQKVTILKCAKIPCRTKTSQCDLLKSPSVKTFGVLRWWWRRQVFLSGCAVALAVGRGQRSYPDALADDALHLL